MNAEVMQKQLLLTEVCALAQGPVPGSLASVGCVGQWL